MRSSMIEDRLNDELALLAVLNMHKEISNDIDDVINRFSRQKQKRMKIEDWSKTQKTNELLNLSFFLLFKKIL
jgi:hypothetical protein